MRPPPEDLPSNGPKHHRTIDRVTRILEEVVYHPGIGFAELTRALDAPKSSIHSFVQGLQANGWLYEENRRFYLGPAVYGLTMASGNIRAGMVSQQDLDQLHAECGLTIFLGVQAGDHLIYIGDSGTDSLTGFAARSNIRRELIATSGGKAFLVDRGDEARNAYLKRMQNQDPDKVSEFLSEFTQIKESGFAVNRRRGTQTALATLIRNRSGGAAAAVIAVGETSKVEPRMQELKTTMREHVALWSARSLESREPI